ncbi:MAG: hypothetical protein HUJ25_13065, partial [Crocinitomicaceae bacterium]|nr:hypothetical protein [Crocinitomicaceae bacterium]
MNPLLLISSLFWAAHIYAHSIDTTQYISVEKLVSQQTISAKFEGLGGHSGNCMKVIIENHSSDSAYVWIEGGRRLFSDDSSLQDIFLIKNTALAIAPLDSKSTPLYGFCCQAKNGGPGSKSTFQVGKMAPPKWVELANFVEKYEFPTGAVQQAVWVLSDHHEISTVHHTEPEVIAPLKRKLAELLGMPVPWYSVIYAKDSASVFSNRPEKIYGDMDFYINTNAVVSAVVKNQYGENVSFPIRETSYDPGTYTFTFQQRLEGWEPGRYTKFIDKEYNLILKKK